MSKQYDSKQPVVVHLELDLDNTRAKHSLKFNPDSADAQVLMQLQLKYGDAAIVEALAGIHLGSVMQANAFGIDEFLIHPNSEQIGVTLFGVASAVASLADEDEDGTTFVLDSNKIDSNVKADVETYAEDKNLTALKDLAALLSKLNTAKATN